MNDTYLVTSNVLEQFTDLFIAGSSFDSSFNGSLVQFNHELHKGDTITIRIEE